MTKDGSAGRHGSEAENVCRAAADAALEDQLILVDRRNRAVGSLGKQAVHERGLRHRAFSIFLVDSEQRLLLQQRHLSKYHSGGLWANSCCGHPRWGESTLAGARRRLREELGSTAPLTASFRTRYRAQFESGLCENEEVTVYFGPCPGRLRPDPGEIAATRLVGLDELRRQVAAEPDRFAVWLRHYLAEHADEIAAAISDLTGEPRA